jgi:hypothetical protein
VFSACFAERNQLLPALPAIAKHRDKVPQNTVFARVGKMESGNYRRGWSVSHRAVPVFAAGLRSPATNRPSGQGAVTNGSANRVRQEGECPNQYRGLFCVTDDFVGDRAGSTSRHALPALMLLIIGCDTPNHLAKKPH